MLAVYNNIHAFRKHLHLHRFVSNKDVADVYFQTWKR